MTRFLKQSTAVTVKLGPFVDDTDGKTAETGLTIKKADVRLSKNGGDMAAANADQGASDVGAAHDELGYYDISLNTTDTNTLGALKVMVTESGALPVWADFMVVTANIWDSLFSTDVLDVSVTQIGGAAVSTSTAQLGVNVVQAAGTAWGSGAITAASIAADAIGASELAADAVAEIADAVWDELQADHTGATTMGGSLAEASADTSALVAMAVWDEDLSTYSVANSAGKLLADVGGGSSPEAIADAVWDEALSGHTTAGTAGAGMAYARDGSAVYGSTTAAENLKKWFDGTGYNASASTVGTATNVTNGVNANLTNIQGTSALMTAFANMLATAVQATVVAGTNTTTVISTGLTSAVNDFYKGKMLFVKTGALAGQGGKLVTAYDGATKRLTVEALTAALSPDDVVVLVG